MKFTRNDETRSISHDGRVVAIFNTLHEMRHTFEMIERVYEEGLEAPRPEIQDCTREYGHEGPCNGWPCDWVISQNPVFCEHANEVPAQCPCRVSCYCKRHTCAPNIGNHRHRDNQDGTGYCLDCGKDHVGAMAPNVGKSWYYRQTREALAFGQRYGVSAEKFAELTKPEEVLPTPSPTVHLAVTEDELAKLITRLIAERKITL